ncbi:MAG: type I methionyl aminopeptidase [Bacillota bacterium]|nr:type I methionyl aminopeptidase [Bacillota bacterium]
MIILKSTEEIAIMREAGRIAAGALHVASALIRPGVTTRDIDEAVEAYIVKEGGRPAFKGYRGFPASVCASLNDEVVHGLPSARRRLRAGDIVSIDVGAVFEGFVGDTAWTFPVGEMGVEAEKLLRTTYRALHAGIARAVPGKRLSDIGAAVQEVLEEAGLGVVREYTGHGIGRNMHEEPMVPNYGPPGMGPLLEVGLVLAIEPMATTGDWATRLGKDGWTVSTRDHSLAAHFEHTVAILEHGPEILTWPEVGMAWT